jgi:hypothetical protein
MNRLAFYATLVLTLLAVVLAGTADFPIPGFPWH